MKDAEAYLRSWVDQIGMVKKRRTEAGTLTIVERSHIHPAEAGLDQPGNSG